MMRGKEKLYFLLDAIGDARTIAPSGQPLMINPMNDLNDRIRDHELSQLLAKLEKDEGVLRVIRIPGEVTEDNYYHSYNEAKDSCYHIELLPAFDEYYLKIQQEPEYQEFTGKKPQTPNPADKTRPKYDRKALEKIWNVLQEIEEKRQLKPEGDEIQIQKYPYGSMASGDRDVYYQERKAILPKLVSLGAIKDLREGEEGAWQFWGFYMGDKYFYVFSEHEEEYKKVAQDYQKSREEEKIDSKDVVYEVKYSEKTREIVVNNFLLAKPDFFRENEVVFTYIYGHPNGRISKDRIEKETGIQLTKTLPKILENLGFTGELRRVFFDVSSEGVLFRNPVTREDLDELKIKYLKLE